LGQERLDEKARWLDDGGVGGQRPLGLDGVDAAVDDVGATDAVCVKEVDDGLPSGTLGVKQGRPPLEERDEDLGLLVTKQIESLRKIGLEREREAIREPHAVLHQVAARLDEAPERAHVRALMPQRLELLAMAHEQLQGDRGVGGIILRSARGEGAAVLRERAGVDGEDHEDVVLEEGRHNRALGELEADDDAAASEALAQLLSPVLDGFWAVFDDRKLDRVGAGDL